MNIYKLTYPNRDTAISDLISKRIIDEYYFYVNGTHAVVELPNENTFDIDIMTETEYVFENEIHPNTPDHNFLGWE